MTRGRRPHPPAAAGADVATQAEGYLQARAHHTAARAEAEALCGRMPWLTAAQAEDLTRHYVDHRLVLTRTMLGATVARAGELRQEYEGRYLELRRDLLRRHTAGLSVLLAAAAGLHAAVAWIWLR
ncbi:hypothetical protein ACFUIW_14590 [Streptomyces sp. NPDC057245]|uniref:hypothetical protein n=1 Tax=Streptomyces TaxID=1883 RepID=UPI001C1E12A6|nr:hypothetical protein [Streptomyces sp. A108]MBU6530297.1 hypothetical protein [Streptomyces sp. A108]